jgi:hypothetical protein
LSWEGEKKYNGRKIEKNNGKIKTTLRTAATALFI